MPNVFYVPIFFIVFRETIETSIVVSILLTFLKQQLGSDTDVSTYKRLRKQIWTGTVLGLVICLAIGAGMIGAFYGLGTDKWSSTENIWEGVFSIIAVIVITIMGAALLRISKLQEKWRVKLAKALESKDHHYGTKFSRRFKMWCEKYAMFILPFVTVLREGLEAIVFVGGVSLGAPAQSIPLPTVVGLIAGTLVGYLVYKGGSMAPLQAFLIASTCFLYLIAAGLFSKAVLLFELNEWNHLTGGDAAETGSGAGSYDIQKSVWHINCCNPILKSDTSGWSVFYALFGWTNSATYGSVISYNVYWLAVIVWFLSMLYFERRGHWPLMKGKPSSDSDASPVDPEDGVISKAVDSTAAPFTTELTIDS